MSDTIVPARSAARAQTRRSSGEQDSGRSLESSATPATSQRAESSGDNVDRATPEPRLPGEKPRCPSGVIEADPFDDRRPMTSLSSASASSATKT